MIVKTKSTSYECSRAERHNADIYLYRDGDERVIILEDPTITEVIGGEISVVENDADGGGMLMDEIRVDVLATEAELEELRKQQQKNEPVEVIVE